MFRRRSSIESIDGKVLLPTKSIQKIVRENEELKQKLHQYKVDKKREERGKEIGTIIRYAFSFALIIFILLLISSQSN